MLILVFAAVLAAGTGSGSPGTVGDHGAAPAVDGSHNEAHPAPRQAAILRVNRNLEVQGYIELEDDDVIVVRTPRGKVESFSKARILQIVRLVNPEPGQRGLVYMRNGQVREGVIIEDTFEQVTIEIKGVRARLRREFVDYVVLKPTFDQLYREFKESIGPTMHERHLMLGRWLVEQREYELAGRELRELIQSVEQPLPEAERLLRLVEAQMAIRSSAGAMPEDASEDAALLTPHADRGRILTREEVNLMRVYEIDFDSPPRVAVSPETIRKMIETYSANDVIPATQAERNALFRADPLEIVRRMFMLRSRELYGEVQVLTEPPALNLFRQRVHNGWLLQNCATSGCHGGHDAGALMLHRQGFQDERVRYTNLLILERLDVDPDWPLINYENPEMSLLIQYALPREAARRPHPEVRGWRPVFTRPNDRQKQDTIRWIKAMMQPRPEYPIEFEPPVPARMAEEVFEGGRLPR